MADPGELNPSPSKWSLLQVVAVCAFSSVGYSGFTSLPFYVYNHSGYFTIAYYSLLLLICTPICYVQIKLGALYKRGLVGIFSHLVPIYKGVAAALLIMTYFRSITHALEISYGVYYMFASCKQPFPWAIQAEVNMSSHEAKITIFDSIKSTPEDSYFINDFLQRSVHIGSWGPLVWYLVLCALFVWALVYFIILKGSPGFAKVLTILAPATAVLAVIILIYGYAAVPTSWDSVSRFLLTVDKKPWSQSDLSHFLSYPEFWLDALDLHIYGLGLWAGTLPFLGTHISCTKRIVKKTWGILMLTYTVAPFLLVAMLMPYIDPKYPAGILGTEVGIKPGLFYLFVSIPHKFHKHGLSPFMLFLIYVTYILVSIQHLSFHILMIWENLWPSIPKVAMVFFKRTPFLLAAFCFLSFLLTAPYLSQCGVYLYQIVRFYVDRLLFALVIFSMVPFIIGFVRQESLRMPIDRIFMGVWYAAASLLAACFLIYNFIVYLYPESILSYEQRWAEHLGWCISLSPLLLGVILGAIHTMITLKGSFMERLILSLKAGSPPSNDAGDDGLSVDTGDTDLKSPCSSRHNTPMTQARAPLLKHHNTLPEKHSQLGNSHTLFPQSLAHLPVSQPNLHKDTTAHNCINSPTAGREPFSPEATAAGYGTLQMPKSKANIEVVMRSTSDGNIARL
ncbi:unnamed protein product [Lymnaea stagnalis]|uniref:Uncharacterized protein n=1 Tax=Lymnaea stagnalis TaxID=6523 RepID=A0AAV2H0U4_LYMST